MSLVSNMPFKYVFQVRNLHHDITSSEMDEGPAISIMATSAAAGPSPRGFYSIHNHN